MTLTRPPIPITLKEVLILGIGWSAVAGASIAGLLFAWWQAYWNLLGWHY